MELNRVRVAHSDEVTVVADSAGSATLWSRADEAMFGHSREDERGANPNLIIPEKIRDRHWKVSSVRARGGDSLRRTDARSACCASGRTRIPIEFTVAVMRDEAGGLGRN